ncbi:hypothetical protein D3C76_377060 [compost metagenome]|uniref:hypothetical protein n=1 Tax=Pseudomonas TaxID=286 RepID=UPI000D459714|nr:MULTISPECIES: hypothetical protein [Pseudomonas]MCM2459526.1 hypothetical protein [Pseudomonas sp. CG7]PTR26829.1 ribosome modulation factor [Pseudomonas sp. GV085]CAH0130286.1 hypothetical protein SRABI130_00281 [Pseudomonas sp. Bi130]VVP13192.1 hypothetical protein PS893_03440 [Pseudomonas fluorescens]
MIITLHELEELSTKAEKKPFDVGFESGLSGRTLFDCPYGHVTDEAYRQRHEWLEGFLTALAHNGTSGAF